MNRPYRFGDVVEWDGIGTGDPRWFIVCGEPTDYMAFWLGTKERALADGKTHHIGANGINERLLTGETIMSSHTRSA